MNGRGEVRMFLAGDEYEVREISAAAFLEAGRYAEELFGIIGGGEENRALIRAAAIAAESVFLRDGRAFPTAAEVLDAFTAAEIFEIAAVNPIPPLTEKKTEEDGEAFSAAPAVKTADSSFSAAQEKKTSISDNAEEITSFRHTEAEPSFMQTREKRELFAGFYGAADGASAKAEGEVSSPDRVGADMEYVSGFFERDSRRYGGAFTFY